MGVVSPPKNVNESIPIDELLGGETTSRRLLADCRLRGMPEVDVSEFVGECAPPFDLQ